MTHRACIDFEKSDIKNFCLQFTVIPTTEDEVRKILKDLGVSHDSMSHHNDAVTFDVYLEGDYDYSIDYEKDVVQALSDLGVDINVVRRGKVTEWVTL